MIGELSGKAGCVVASRNRNGSYLRTRTIPINPKTTSQQNARNNLSAIAATWRTLTDAQRAAWAAYGLTITLFDSLGRPYTPTGSQAYSSVNRTIYVYDPTAALATTPPVVAAPTALLSITPTATSV